jgi:very-short-patch-repair endonuclease
VELDGAAHDHEAAQVRDVQRTAYLARCGVHVLRFENRDVLTNLEGVLAEIKRSLAIFSPRTTPSSPPRSRGLSHPSSSEEGI